MYIISRKLEIYKLIGNFMTEKRIKTIGIKTAAYDIIKKVASERKGTTKPDGICDIASEAIEIAFGQNQVPSATSTQPSTLSQAG